MNKLYMTLLALAAIGLAAPAIAEGCTTSNPEVAQDTPAGLFYVDNDACQPECSFSIWIYQESNNVEGLQRGDEVVDDTMGGTCYEADTIIL